MKKIKRIGRIDPGTRYEWFIKNYSVWQDLKQGKVVEVPNELAEVLSGIQILEDVKENSSRKIKKIEDINEVTNLDED